MLVDARSLAANQTIEADACVVGAGPVGLTVALELEAAGLQVCVLESGSEDGVERQEPLAGEVAGDSWYPDLAEARARGLGGTAQLWVAELAPNVRGLRLGRLSAKDFAPHEHAAWSGWPFDLGELEDYYERAAALFAVGAYDPSPETWIDEAQPGPLPLSRFATEMFRLAPRTPFTHELPSRLRQSSRATVYVNAHVLRVETTADGTEVRQLAVAASPDRSFQARARVYVLAAGGIETPRLLLLSSRDRGGGLGNVHDLVGRFFMDHPTASTRLVLAGPEAARRLAFYDVRQRGERRAFACLTPDEDALREHRLLNSCGIVVPDVSRHRRAIDAAVRWRRAARGGRLPERPWPTTRDLLRGADAIALAVGRKASRRLPRLARLAPRLQLVDAHAIGPVAGWSRLARPGRLGRRFELYHVLEQAPEPERRITLGATLDRFGRPLARLRWFISDDELESMRRTQELLAADLASAGIGRLTTTVELAGGDDVLRHVFPSEYHHVGTTRMHDDPRQGVVDSNCRLHGTANLYVAGTSVFPTEGYVNPTLTAVALAVRLADHIGQTARTLPERAAPERRAAS